MDKVELKMTVDCEVVRKRGDYMEKLKAMNAASPITAEELGRQIKRELRRAAKRPKPLMQGQFNVQHVRDGEVINEFPVLNGITDAGMNAAFDAVFRGGTQYATWYVGLIDDASFSELDGADTMLSHGGWIENVDYDEASRPAWGPAAAAGRQIANTVRVEFTISDEVDIRGLFITTNATKGGTDGLLWATTAFPSVEGVEDGDVIRIIYAIAG